MTPGNHTLSRSKQIAENVEAPKITQMKYLKTQNGTTDWKSQTTGSILSPEPTLSSIKYRQNTLNGRNYPSQKDRHDVESSSRFSSGRTEPTSTIRRNSIYSSRASLLGTEPDMSVKDVGGPSSYKTSYSLRHWVGNRLYKINRLS